MPNIVVHQDLAVDHQGQNSVYQHFPQHARPGIIAGESYSLAEKDQPAPRPETPPLSPDELVPHQATPYTKAGHLRGIGYSLREKNQPEARPETPSISPDQDGPPPLTQPHITFIEPSKKLSEASNGWGGLAGELDEDDDTFIDENIDSIFVEDDDDELLLAEDEHDAEPITWWFAGKGIPMLAATLGPLANMTSIMAIISSWKIVIPQSPNSGNDIGIPDPHWEIAVNITSLVLGFVGNFVLMLNYAQRIPYKYCMPLTIGMWYLASGLLMGILTAMHYRDPPKKPEQEYSQGYYYGIISACLYLIAASLLFINILGFLRGHYPAHVSSSKNERSLMIQNILFLIWLAGGAGVFSTIEGWSYPNAVYFANVTLLTVGFGDFYPTKNLTRGLVIPFSLGGIVMLGLIVTNIHGLVVELGHNDILRAQINRRRKNTLKRATRNSVDVYADQVPAHLLNHKSNLAMIARTVSRLVVLKRKPTPKMVLLRASRDRFMAMRKIQLKTLEWKRWSALLMSITAFFLLWLVGAVVFMCTERITQPLSYFEAIYFCYVSLVTIGYGDLSPKSPAGRAFFLIWSLMSIPSITVLISSMGTTVIQHFQDVSLKVAEYSVLPKAGIRSTILKRYRRWRVGEEEERKLFARDLARAAEKLKERQLKDLEHQHPQIRAAHERARLREQRKSVVDEMIIANIKTLPADYTFSALVNELSAAIREVGAQIGKDKRIRYSYEEWVEFTRLIRACEEVKPSKIRGEQSNEWDELIDDDEGFVLWDWIGEDSPLVNENSEPEWLLNKLCLGMKHLVKFRERERSRSRRNSEVTIREAVTKIRHPSAIGAFGSLSVVSTRSAASTLNRSAGLKLSRAMTS